MGRDYLPGTHGPQRAFGWPGGAFPEAVRIFEATPLAFPFSPPMFDIEGIDLYFWYGEPQFPPEAGPILFYRRDIYTEQPYCEIEPPIFINFEGHFVYSVQFWPASLPIDPSPYPNPGYILHRLFLYWDNFLAFPWGWARAYSTLTGWNTPAGWTVFPERVGLASPPCTLGSWLYGWGDIVMTPTEWPDLQEPITYAESDPVLVIMP